MWGSAFIRRENVWVSQIEEILLWVEEVIKEVEEAAENGYDYEWWGLGGSVEHFLRLTGGKCWMAMVKRNDFFCIMSFELAPSMLYV